MVPLKGPFVGWENCASCWIILLSRMLRALIRYKEHQGVLVIDGG